MHMNIMGEVNRWGWERRGKQSPPRDDVETKNLFGNSGI